MRPRLVQRIYFAGLVQFLIVAAGITLLTRQSRRPPFFLDVAQLVAGTLTAESDSPEALRAAIARVHATMRWSLIVYDETGAVVGSAGVPDGASAATSSATVNAPTTGDARRQGFIELPLRSGGVGHLWYSLPPRGAPPGPEGLGTTAVIVIIVVGISSWLTARSLAVPLARLSATTKAFGAGDFGARVRMNRSDELGDVATAFDEMAERVAKSIRAERELLANVSHELRTPLQRIHVAVELAAEGDAATARESLGEIAEDLQELERIVDDVLTATRLSLTADATRSAVPPLRTQPVDVASLIEKAVARFRTAHPSRGIDTSRLAPLPTLAADPVLLRRVIDNLLENSHKYTDDDMVPIALSTWIAPKGVVIEVRDHGAGIAPDDLERVFEPFFRADRSRTRATGGFGLGLPLARRIVESHGGKLVLESELGLGTTARIELPRDTRTDS